MGSTSVNTKTRFLYQAFYTKTRFSIPYILHENKIFHHNELTQKQDFRSAVWKNYTDHFDSKKRIRKIHSEKEFE